MFRIKVINTAILLLLRTVSPTVFPDNTTPVNYRETALSKIGNMLNITVQPENQIDCKGNKVTFSVLIDGSNGPVHYQWQRKRPLDTSFATFGAKDSTKLAVYNIGTGSEAPDGTWYQVIVSDQNGTITSGIASLKVNQITGISPVGVANYTLDQGEDLLLKVLTSGNSPLSYQWIKKFGSNDWRDVTDDSTVSGSQFEQLNFRSVSVSDSGIYKVRVTFPTMNGNQCTETSTIARRIYVTPVPDNAPPFFVGLTNESKILCQKDLEKADWNDSLNDILFLNISCFQIEKHSTMFDLPSSHFSDNMTPADELILHWGIYMNGYPAMPLSDEAGTILDNMTGQISLHHENIDIKNQLPEGLGCQIVYWLEDGSGNLTPDSLRHKINLTFAPRPAIISDF
jgi:hypothetical protein